MEPKTYLNWTEDQSDKIEEILLDLGYELSDRGRYWQSTAAYRDGDNRTALQIWKNTGIWKDFVQGTSYMPFKKLLELSCKDDSKVENIITSLKSDTNSFIPVHKAPKMETDQFFTHDEIGVLLPHYDFYNKKSITDKTLKIYRAGFSMSGKMNGRFVFPVYDPNEKVIGLSGRHLLWDKNSSMPKWKHLGRKTRWVYPFNIPDYSDLFYKKINETKEVILVEGIGDSLALTEQGFHNHMVIFGLDLSSKQISHLLSLDLEKITIATNNDYDKSKNAGRDAAIKILVKLIKYFDPQKVQIKLPLLKDFGEMLEQQVEIHKWVQRKINPLKQVSKILENKRNIKDKKCVKILEDYLEKLSFESDTIG
jgi:hypothetical protein